MPFFLAIVGLLRLPDGGRRVRVVVLVFGSRRAAGEGEREVGRRDDEAHGGRVAEPRGLAEPEDVGPELRAEPRVEGRPLDRRGDAAKLGAEARRVARVPEDLAQDEDVRVVPREVARAVAAAEDEQERLVGVGALAPVEAAGRVESDGPAGCREEAG